MLIYGFGQSESAAIIKDNLRNSVFMSSLILSVLQIRHAHKIIFFRSSDTPKQVYYLIILSVQYFEKLDQIILCLSLKLANETI